MGGGGERREMERCWHHCSCVERAHAKRPHMAHIRRRQPSNISPKVAIFAGCSSAHFNSLFYGNQKTVRVLTVPPLQHLWWVTQIFTTVDSPTPDRDTSAAEWSPPRVYPLQETGDFCLKTEFLGCKMLHYFVSINIKCSLRTIMPLWVWSWGSWVKSNRHWIPCVLQPLWRHSFCKPKKNPFE